MTTAINDQGAEFDQLIDRLKSGPKDKGHAVIVVDDEPAIRRLVCRSIKGLGGDVEIHEAEHGEEALYVLNTLRERKDIEPVLIVTDLEMPVMDGWELIETLRKEYVAEGKEFGIPIVVLSASTGVKGALFKKSVHADKRKYEPLGAIAKETCIKPAKYDAQGEASLVSWIKYFLKG